MKPILSGEKTTAREHNPMLDATTRLCKFNHIWMGIHRRIQQHLRKPLNYRPQHNPIQAHLSKISCCKHTGVDRIICYRTFSRICSQYVSRATRITMIQLCGKTSISQQVIHEEVRASPPDSGGLSISRGAREYLATMPSHKLEMLHPIED